VPARRPRGTAAGAKSNALGVIRLSESTGSSSRGWEDAVAAAVKASKVRSPVGVEVSRLWADWEGGKLSRFHATVKVAYRQALKAPSRTRA
jgi:flavin-binding protein dodecin